MHFDLTDEQQDIRRLVRDFAQGEVKPVAEELDREKRFPYEIVEKLGELGLMGVPYPEKYGGADAGYLAYAIVVEELTRVDSSVAITLAQNTSLATYPIYAFGSEEQKQEWMPQLCSGQALGGFGLTEPEAGSDAGNVRTTAREEDGEWVVNGAKQFITNAGTDISRFTTITARTGDERGLEHPGPERHARLRGRRALPQDGLERVRHAAALVRRLPRAGREPRGRARAGLQAVPRDARRRPHQRVGDGRRLGPGRARTRHSPTRRSARRSASRSRSSRRSR